MGKYIYSYGNRRLHTVLLHAVQWRSITQLKWIWKSFLVKGLI